MEFHLGHGDMIRLLRGCGFEIEDLHEIRPEPGVTTRYPYVTLEWAPQWPGKSERPANLPEPAPPETGIASEDLWRGPLRIALHAHASAVDRVDRHGYGARPWPCPRGQSAAVSSASRGRRLTGKPVTESNLSLRAPAQKSRRYARPSSQELLRDWLARSGNYAPPSGTYGAARFQASGMT